MVHLRTTSEYPEENRLRDALAAPLHNPITNLDRFTDADDIVRHAFRARQIDGREPFVRSFTIDEPVAPIALLPADATIERCVTTDSHLSALARERDCTILVRTFPNQTMVAISATSDAIGAVVEASMRGRAPDRPMSDAVSLRTWHMGCKDEPRSNDRRVSTTRWSAIAHNYPSDAAASLRQLMLLDRPAGQGKLILWHGEPGTGKTTALRAMLHAWQPWCSGQYIADPEKLFSHPGYIADVITKPPLATRLPKLDRVTDPEEQWRLLIAEDSDEFLRATARRDSGAALGRVLNLADGLLGQGHNTLILLTTNEELHRMHPALVRPGRCLARVEFTRFSTREADAWLPTGLRRSDQPLTLAELIEMRGDFRRIGAKREVETVGQYL